jgi:hypothetical protein
VEKGGEDVTGSVTLSKERRRRKRKGKRKRARTTDGVHGAPLFAAMAILFTQ